MVFKSRTTLGIILYHMGNLWEAEKVQRELLDTTVKALGPEREKTILSMQNLAVTFSSMEGREGEAAELYRKVVASTQMRIAVTSHP